MLVYAFSTLWRTISCSGVLWRTLVPAVVQTQHGSYHEKKGPTLREVKCGVVYRAEVSGSVYIIRRVACFGG